MPEPVAWYFELQSEYMETWLETVDIQHPDDAFEGLRERAGVEVKNVTPLVPAEDGKYE